MLSQYDTRMSAEWQEVCSQVKQGLKRLGHDIPITAYSAEDELKGVSENKKRSHA
jgi:hypothetical protein